MACSITVDFTKTTGHLIAGALQEIYVQGTVQNCNSVKVTLTCGNVTLPAAQAQVSPASNLWWHTFKNLPSACACNGQIKVRAECDDGLESCVNADHDSLVDLKCKPKPGWVICPAVSISTGQFGECQSDGTRSVTVSATVQGQGSYTADLRDSVNTILDGPKSGTGNLTLTHTGLYPGGKPQTFEVNLAKPGGCGPSSHTVHVPPCGGGTGGPQGGGSWKMSPPRLAPGPPLLDPGTHPPPFEEVRPPGGPGPITKKSNKCGSMVWIVGAALSLAAAAAAVTLAVNLCVPGATAISWWWAIGPAIGAGALVALWYLLCGLIPDCDCPTACDWAQIGTMTAFASAAVIGWLAGCCPVLAWVSAAFLAAYGGALAAWLKACEPGACKALNVSLVALVSGAIPAISYIALVPALAACGSKIAAAAAATVAGVLGVAAAIKCKGS